MHLHFSSTTPVTPVLSKWKLLRAVAVVHFAIFKMISGNTSKLKQSEICTATANTSSIEKEKIKNRVQHLLFIACSENETNKMREKNNKKRRPDEKLIRSTNAVCLFGLLWSPSVAGGNARTEETPQTEEKWVKKN